MQPGKAGQPGRGYWRHRAGEKLTTLAAALVGLAPLAGRSAEVGCRQPLRICALGLHGDGLAAVKADAILLLRGLDGLEDWRAHPLLRLHMPGY